MILVEMQGNHKFLDIRFRYSSDYVRRVKRVPGRRYNPSNKTWVIPVGALSSLENLFRGELVYVTPRHEILQQPPPPPPAWYNDIPKYDIPGLKIPLYPKQVLGANFLNYRVQKDDCALLCDGVGLGKTGSSIGAAKLLQQAGLVKRTLVMCPANLKAQWKKSGIEKFTHDSSIIVGGTREKRRKLYEELHDYDFIIINYELLLQDFDLIKQLDVDLIIYDEIHKLKNRNGKMNNKATKLNAPYKIALTGTPLLNRPDELYGIMQVLKPKLFGDFRSFKKQYLYCSWNGRWEEHIGYRNLDVLRDQIGAYILRRTDDEDLPEVVKITREVDMSPKQLQAQTEIWENMKQTKQELINLRSGKQRDKEKIEQLENSILGQTALLAACSNSLELFSMSTSAYVRKRYGHYSKGVKSSPKLKELINIVEEIVSGGDKVIIFSEYERMVRIIKRELSKMIPVVTYTGQMTQKQKQEAVDKFVNDTSIKAFVATEAAEEGLNLQVASYLINYDLAWTPASMQQRIGRIRRLSSKYKSVKVISLVSTQSISDKLILDAQERKRNLFNTLVENTETMDQLLDKLAQEVAD